MVSFVVDRLDVYGDKSLDCEALIGYTKNHLTVCVFG